MTAAHDPKSEAERLLFSAVLRPHRSLSPQGLALVVGLIALGLALASIPFFLLGAWPVVGFFGLDAGLIWLAFRINAAEARNEEQIFLSRIHLLIRNLDWRGAIREAEFNPRWLRLEREEHPEWGIERLSVVQGKARQVVGACLNHEDRAEFAQVFSNALIEAKR
ncbi:MAG: DUF2244 domain-containing protein [Proteobacteria bacterium]|nr:DUF2244 domain-containing protein [Pseudomonadota bacterium]